MAQASLAQVTLTILDLTAWLTPLDTPATTVATPPATLTGSKDTEATGGDTETDNTVAKNALEEVKCVFHVMTL